MYVIAKFERCFVVVRLGRTNRGESSEELLSEQLGVDPGGLLQSAATVGRWAWHGPPNRPLRVIFYRLPSGRIIQFQGKLTF